MLEISIVLFVFTVAAWDILRRHINDNKAAREFRSEQATRLLQELSETTEAVRELLKHVRERQVVQEKAMVEFITQAQQLIQKSEDRRAEAQKNAMRKSL